jgi:hypothetical protein
VIHREILSRIGLYEASTVQRVEFDWFSEDFTEWECTPFIYCPSIVSCVTANLLKSSKCEEFSVHRLYSRISSLCIILFDETTEDSLLSDILICLVWKGSRECSELTFRNIGKMIEFDNMDTEMEQLESYAKSRKSEVGRLHEDYDRSGRKWYECIFNILDLRIYLYSIIILSMRFWLY